MTPRIRLRFLFALTIYTVGLATLLKLDPIGMLAEQGYTSHLESQGENP